MGIDFPCIHPDRNQLFALDIICEGKITVNMDPDPRRMEFSRNCFG